MPRVILLGRLSLYGERAARLHDEIIAIAARWHDRGVRGEPLRPYAEEAEARARDVLDAALRASQLRDVGDAVKRRLLGGVERDVADLLPYLGSRAEAVVQRARATLAARGQKEAREMAEILQAQRARIEATVAGAAAPQMTLEFSEEEERQLEADRRHWQKRLRALEEEVDREPERIRGGYVVKATRVEPVGVVYLWPVSG